MFLFSSQTYHILYEFCIITVPFLVDNIFPSFNKLILRCHNSFVLNFNKNVEDLNQVQGERPSHQEGGNERPGAGRQREKRRRKLKRERSRKGRVEVRVRENKENEEGAEGKEVTVNIEEPEEEEENSNNEHDKPEDNNNKKQEKLENTSESVRRTTRNRGKLKEDRSKRNRKKGGNKEGRRGGGGHLRESGSTQDLVMGLAEALEEFLNSGQHDADTTREDHQVETGTCGCVCSKLASGDQDKLNITKDRSEHGK